MTDENVAPINPEAEQPMATHVQIPLQAYQALVNIINEETKTVTGNKLLGILNLQGPNVQLVHVPPANAVSD